jgi:hypothetical protein
MTDLFSKIFNCECCRRKPDSEIARRGSLKHAKIESNKTIPDQEIKDSPSFQALKNPSPRSKPLDMIDNNPSIKEMTVLNGPVFI